MKEENCAILSHLFLLLALMLITILEAMTIEFQLFLGEFPTERRRELHMGILLH